MAVPILLYHHIDEPPPRGTPSRSNYVTPKNFEKQMKWLDRLGYKGLSLVEALPYIRNEKQGKIAAITFDDGFLSVYKNAMPILDRLGFTATNFFVTNRTGLDNAWDAPQAKREAIMSEEEINLWIKHGHEAGSHTLDHVHLGGVSLSKARDQIFQSKDALEKIIAKPVCSFAYPYGDENVEVCALVEAAGYQFGVTTRRGRATGKESPFEYPRFSIRRNDTILHFLAKCLIR